MGGSCDAERLAVCRKAKRLFRARTEQSHVLLSAISKTTVRVRERWSLHEEDERVWYRLPSACLDLVQGCRVSFAEPPSLLCRSGDPWKWLECSYIQTGMNMMRHSEAR